MDVTKQAYWEAVQKAEEQLVPFLRTLEAIQEEIHFGREQDVQERLRTVAENIFPTLCETMKQLTPPADDQPFHAKLCEALSHCSESYASLLKGSGRNFAEWFLRSRQAQCQALYLLYDLRAQLPTLRQYWVTSEALPSWQQLETQAEGVSVPVGFMQKPRTDTHHQYSLYVPENYTPQQSWPLIVCLHGGYGQGNEYIWTWLRPAKSNGYILLSPKSIGPTWSVLQPPLDIRSIQAMITEVCETYTVDRTRVYLSGLSDGGTFSYIFGLAAAELFAGIAPIAGDFHPMMDPLLRQKKGVDTPLLVIHGVHDKIFPIETARTARQLFERLGYTVTYHELPDWGHAYPYKINQQIVLPWLTKLSKEQTQR
jgi:pimeloyl-ACP methyl ester carboxylesterase